MNAQAFIYADFSSGVVASELEPDEVIAFVDFCWAAIEGTESFYLPDDPAPRALNCRAALDIIRDVAQIYKWD